MPSFYLDTSAFVKLYIQEDGTRTLIELAQHLDRNQIVILDMALLEFRSAVRRREREGDISGLDASRVLRQVQDDAASIYLLQPSTPAVMEEASRLLDVYPLRAYDALQLAGCLVVRNRVFAPLTFVCADSRLCETAAFEGLATLVPVD
jgi:predicted nucleic acid-binding protein